MAKSKAVTKKPPRRKPVVQGGVLVAQPCECCDAIAVILAAPSGSLFTQEDGVIVIIPPPEVPSYMRIDPTGSNLPHWNPE